MAITRSRSPSDLKFPSDANIEDYDFDNPGISCTMKITYKEILVMANDEDYFAKAMNVKFDVMAEAMIKKFKDKFDLDCPIKQPFWFVIPKDDHDATKEIPAQG